MPIARGRYYQPYSQGAAAMRLLATGAVVACCSLAKYFTYTCNIRQIYELLIEYAFPVLYCLVSCKLVKEIVYVPLARELFGSSSSSSFYLPNNTTVCTFA